MEQIAPASDVPPIKFAIATVASLTLKAERYDTKEDAQAALADLEDKADYIIVEIREGHTPPPDVLEAEEAQIDKQGYRDVDESGNG